jgi:hypothetical protein
MSGWLVPLVVLVSPLLLMGIVMFMGWVERRLVFGLTSDELRQMLHEAATPDRLEEFVATTWRDVLVRRSDTLTR